MAAPRRTTTDLREDPLVHITPRGHALRWRLPQLMANAGFRFGTQLHEALQAEGLELSYGHVNRLLNQAPARLSVDLQFTLCRILDCSADDLWKDAGEVASDAESTGEARQRLKQIKPVRARGLE